MYHINCLRILSICWQRSSNTQASCRQDLSQVCWNCPGHSTRLNQMCCSPENTGKPKKSKTKKKQIKKHETGSWRVQNECGCRRHAHGSKVSHRNRPKLTKVDPVEQVLTTKCERLLRSNPNSMLMLISSGHSGNAEKGKNGSELDSVVYTGRCV